MLKKIIKYIDFDGNPREETFYFNLTQAEITELELSEEGGGLTAKINKIVEAQDNATIIKLFKEIIGKAYGEKSADGKYFVKNDQVRDAFMATQAYSDLFVELSTDAGAAAAFMNGIIPANMVNPSVKP
jgi:hypothetical protein